MQRGRRSALLDRHLLPELLLHAALGGSALRGNHREQEREEHEEPPCDPARLVKNGDGLAAAQHEIGGAPTHGGESSTLAGLEQHDRREDQPIEDDQD